MYRILSLTLLVIAFIWLWRNLKNKNVSVLALPGFFLSELKRIFSDYKTLKKDFKWSMNKLNLFLDISK